MTMQPTLETLVYMCGIKAILYMDAGLEVDEAVKVAVQDIKQTFTKAETPTRRKS